jgi:osmoprotectant transport system permease protein
LRVGSKRFTESYILGEIIVQSAPGKAEHRPGLGNTGILYAALKAGSIDLYPEYTGTIAREILKLEGAFTLEELQRRLAVEGLGVGVKLGFNNTYALAMRDAEAKRLGVQNLSDLARQPQLKLGLSQEFIGRADGWPGLKSAYGMKQAPAGLDHGLAYEAIAAGKIDVMDIYSTDAKIERFGLRVLEDDRGYFPHYDAVLLYRLDLPQRFPQEWKALQSLEGRIDAQKMIRMNAAAELEKKSFADAARQFTAVAGGAVARERNLMSALFGDDFWRLTREHLLLVFVSLAAGILVAVPLGVVAAKVEAATQPIMAIVGVIQTIPALALLAFLIPVLGSIGTVPALIALFLYSLLPIVRNTYTGLEGVGPGMRQAALALGLKPLDRMLLIELPLAAPSILAGIKTAAVIGVGTATIAAFIGAGGYGERIAQGLALNDNTTLLAGAIPAAALALITQGLFELIERLAFPALRNSRRAC